MKRRSVAYFPNLAGARALTVLLLVLSWSGIALGGEISQVDSAPPTPFLLPDVRGGFLDFGDLAGKVVVVNFWATWCSPCIEEMPSLRRLAQEMRGKPFEIVGVNVAESESRVKTFVQRLEIGFPVVLDRDGAAFDSWRVQVLPTTYVLDGEGRVRYVARGSLEWDGAEIVDMLERMVATTTVAGTPE